MSKMFLIVVLVASAALYDPPRALGFFSCETGGIGPKLRSWFSLERVLPKLAHFNGG